MPHTLRQGYSSTGNETYLDIRDAITLDRAAWFGRVSTSL